ncbi:hypothetical protein B0H15DRAFT_848925 [Mycena belliarum]|uniref:Uncharacterized protein n=1 Tax=Mycena belliarum TaxID=1033014 RepID=A0AAD6XK88_9AGAR|nr:hypothetical protein B0H15DRAFT_848925 [Mycena belliae]
MGVLDIFSGTATKAVPAASDVKLASPEPEGVSSPRSSESVTAAPVKLGVSLVPPTPEATAALQSEEATKPPVARRLTFRTFAHASTHKPILSEAQEHEKKASAANAFAKRLAQPLSSSSEKKAKESALVLRTLIVGPSSNDYATPKLTKAVAKPQLSKVKSQLMQPNSANRVIAQLRALPVMDEATIHGQGASRYPCTPIHAVCLAHPEAEEHTLHFAKLTPDASDASSKSVPNVASVSLDKIASTFGDMHIVDLITAPDLGFGQPGDGSGLLAGAVPTAETIINGIQQITPQLMALGYATGRAILPDHKGVHPPTDRISVLTYWWGLEVVLPPPTLEYLANTQSIAGTLVNFLTALSLINNGVREILPFVRYIAQFIDFEFNAIKRQDKGKGVVCASTWIMPAALVPRPWDFAPPEKASVKGTARSSGNPSEMLSPLPSIPDPATSGPLPTDSSPDARPVVARSSSAAAAPISAPSRMSPLIVHSNSQTAASPAISLK